GSRAGSIRCWRWERSCSFENPDNRPEAALGDFFDLFFVRWIEIRGVSHRSVIRAALREFVEADALDSLDQVPLILGLVRFIDHFRNRLDPQEVVVPCR